MYIMEKGDFYMKRSKIILVIYMLILIMFLCGCSNNEEDKNIDKKVQNEIEYIDKKITGMMNKLNNITLENYEVKTKEVQSQKEKGSSSSKESTSSEGESSGESSGGSGEESGEGSSEGNSENKSNSKESSEGEKGSSSDGEAKDIKVLQMQPSNILVIDKEDIDWNELKSEIELMYAGWNSIILDLYSVNTTNEDILNFSKALDETVISIKAEDKKKSLEQLANLYEYLPKYIDGLSIEESRKNILQTKYNILRAYSIVEDENWKEVQNQLEQADTAYTKVINDVNYIQNKQEEVLRVYVLIKELRNSVSLKDKDIFYIKYKNLMNAIQ